MLIEGSGAKPSHVGAHVHKLQSLAACGHKFRLLEGIIRDVREGCQTRKCIVL